MKTPIQQLIDELNQQIDLLMEKQFGVEWRLEDIRFQSYYDGMMKSLMDVESMLKTRYLKEEKDNFQRTKEIIAQELYDLGMTEKKIKELLEKL